MTRPVRFVFARFVFASILVSGLASAVVLTGCGPIDKEQSYPTGKDNQTGQVQYSDQPRKTIWGDDDSLSNIIFGGKGKEDKGSGIGVNSYLWRAALDTISFMPVANADPFGGVILTDWYESPDTPGQRFKLNVYILDKQLRADGIRVSVFKQKIDGKKQWRDDKVPDTMATSIENAILTRARELRVAQLTPKK